MAAVAALAFVLAAALARRVVPDPWATWAAVLAALSPPALAQATAVAPRCPPARCSAPPRCARCGRASAR